MNTKEKLELLWKYLLLLVIAVFLIRFSGKPHFKMMGKHFNHGKHEMSFYGDDDREIDVSVEKEIVNGDTVMNITINGKPVDVSMFEETGGKMKWVSEDGEVIIIDIDDDHNEGEEDIRIIKKVIKIDEDN
jgi:hypothetical protein|tara:strand:+ start:176 stop:568 length:393 start_codon:yes stop_codon:yes gene_type:complete